MKALPGRTAPHCPRRLTAATGAVARVWRVVLSGLKSLNRFGAETRVVWAGRFEGLR